jgi:hypothetical protein
VKLVEHTFTLHAESGLGNKPFPDWLGLVLSRVHGTMQDTVRMGFLRSSRAPGRPSKGILASSEVRYLGHTGTSDDSTILRFGAPKFGDAAPQLFDQKLFWEEGPSPDDTAFDLFGDILKDVRAKASDSPRFDHPMLRRIAAYETVFKKGLSSISIGGDRLSINNPPTLDTAVSAAARTLWISTPPSERTRLCGKLNMLTVDRRLLGLVLEDGTPVQAVWTGEEFTSLADFLAKDIVIEGLAVYRPSGRLLRIDAESLREASAKDSFFSKLPLPSKRAAASVRAISRSSGSSGFSAIHGIWSDAPATDDEFADAVEQLS